MVKIERRLYNIALAMAYPLTRCNVTKVTGRKADNSQFINLHCLDAYDSWRNDHVRALRKIKEFFMHDLSCRRKQSTATPYYYKSLYDN